MEIIFISHFLAISLSSGNLAMEPSSFMISTNTPEDENPANRARSPAASVCPALRRTPPFLAFNGNICPGLPKSLAFVAGFTKANTVLDLSDAEIPVPQSSPNKSILTVNAVSCMEVLSVTIG